MGIPLRLLILEDEPDDALLMVRQLRRAQFLPEWRRVATAEAYVAALDDPWDLILADYRLPDIDGLRALLAVQERGLDLPFIIVSGTVGEERAVAALQQGADDYLLKDRLSRLGPAVARALENRRLRAEQRRAEAERQANLAQFRSLLQSVPCGIVSADATGRIIFSNAEAERMFGYRGEELLGQAVEVLMPARLQAEHIRHRTARYAAPFMRPVGCHAPMSARRKDGSEFPIEIGFNLVATESGLLVTAVLVDVTERRQLGAARERSERFAQATVDALPAHIAVLDDTGLIVAVNEAWRTFGRANDATIAAIAEGTNYLAVCEQAARQGIGEAAAMATGIRRVLSGEASTFELEYRCDSPMAEHHVRATVTQFPDGGPRAVVVAHEDITARKRADKALRESETRFRRLVEDETNGIYRADPSGQIVLANPALASMLGYGSTAELHGMDLRQLEGDPAGGALPAPVTTDGAVHGRESTWTRQDGSRLTVRMSRTSIRDDGGRLIGFQGIVEDITEQRQLAARLSQAERLSALGELAAGVAHEVNNPLASIIMAAELALRGEHLAPQLRDDLTLIHREAARAGDIVRALLRFARQREPSFEPLQIRDVVDEVLSLEHDRLERHRIEVVRDLGDVPNILGDQDQLVQMLLNLVNNAVDAMRREDERQLVLRAHAATDGVVLQVTDSGPGIAVEVLPRIFDPFFTTKAPGEGTGLGLSISHHIITDHRGTLSAANASPHGACFRAVFPIAPPPAAAGRDAGQRPLVLVCGRGPAASSLTDAASLLEYEARHFPTVEAALGEAVSGDVAALVVLADALPPTAPWCDRLRPTPRVVVVGDAPTCLRPCDALLPEQFTLAALRAALEGTQP